jgi:5'-3' exonuclease
MGIQGLTKLLGDHAPKCIKEQQFNNYFGRKIAVDASMHIYQFLAVVGRQGDQLLSNEAGEVTSHLQGMFYRTARMLEAGQSAARQQRGAICALQQLPASQQAQGPVSDSPSCTHCCTTASSSCCCCCCRMRAGIKPVYVFEGKPPELKIEQLKQRREKRDEADKELAAAKEAGDQEAIEKYSKRTTKVCLCVTDTASAPQRCVCV